MRARGGETRERILDAAWDLAVTEGPAALSMSRVARATGLSRQAVHLHFATRSGLLEAMVHHQDRRSGFIDRAVRTRSLPPVEALEELVRIWCAYLPEILPVAWPLEAAGHRPEDEAAPLRGRLEQLRLAFVLAVERIERDGRLASGWTVEAAADWAWARSHLRNWQLLVVERGWDPETYVDRLVGSLRAELLSPPEGSGSEA